MKRVLLIFAMLLLAGLLAALVTIGWQFAHELPAIVGQVWVNGERVDLSTLTGRQWLVLGVGLSVALVVAAIVLPLVLAVAVALPLLLFGLALVLLFGGVGLVLALLLSPLLLLGWWLWKRARAQDRAGP